MVEEMAFCVCCRFIRALCKKASIGAAYAADPFYFVRSSKVEDLREIGRLGSWRSAARRS